MRVGQLVGALALSATIGMGYYISSAPKDKEPQHPEYGIPLKLTVQVNGNRVDFTMTNTGDHPIAYFDAWQENLGMPGGAWIEAKDAQGKSVTTTSVSPTGQWSPIVYSSQATVVPVKELTLLAPGSSRRATGFIGGSLEAIGKLRENNACPVAVRVGCLVYLDRELSTALSYKTSWLSYPVAGQIGRKL